MCWALFSPKENSWKTPGMLTSRGVNRKLEKKKKKKKKMNADLLFENISSFRDNLAAESDSNIARASRAIRTMANRKHDEQDRSHPGHFRAHHDHRSHRLLQVFQKEPRNQVINLFKPTFFFHHFIFFILLLRNSLFPCIVNITITCASPCSSV